jgi:protein-disulfide isomerase/uncharacterized membrane protein
MSEQKSSSSVRPWVLLVLAIAMMATSAYLTYHFYEVRFPTGLGNASLCNINSFFNCDKSISSEFSNFAGVPISIFGFLTGLFLFINHFVKARSFKGTLATILLLNFISCVGLFLYSLIVLGGLCPFCTLYYIFSIAAYFVFRKDKHAYLIDLKVALTFFTISGVIVLAAKFYTDARVQMQGPSNAELLKLFDGLPRVTEKLPDSEYKLANHPMAKLKMIIFSDFQCPACRQFSKMIPQLKERYKEQLDIEYFFYPLDNSCNPTMDRPLHPSACQAAFVAACLAPSFDTVHDELFENQQLFSDKWLSEYAAKKGVAACAKDKKTKEKILSSIKLGDSIQLGATPTVIVNGIRIDGVMPLTTMFVLLDTLLQ